MMSRNDLRGIKLIRVYLKPEDEEPVTKDAENCNKNESLTADEFKVINMLSESWNMFHDLPIQKDSDWDEFSRHISELQRLVMARETRRRHPESFPTK